MDFYEKTSFVYGRPDGEFKYFQVALHDKTKYGKSHDVLFHDGRLVKTLFDFSYNNETVFSYTCPYTKGPIYISSDLVIREKSFDKSKINAPYYSKEEVKTISKDYVKMKYFPTLPKECIA